MQYFIVPVIPIWIIILLCAVIGAFILIVLCYSLFKKYEDTIRQTTVWKGLAIPFGNLIVNPLWAYLFFSIILWFGGRALFIDQMNEYCILMKSLAVAIFSGGVWASITKSQFMRNVFSDEMRKVIYSKEHLSNRSDIKDLWGRVTVAMYKSKFPDIHEKISNKISEIYLPGDHEYYNDELNYEIDISWVDPNDANNDYIKIVESERSVIKQSEKTDSFAIDFRVGIDIDKVEEEASPTKTSYKFKSMYINGAPIDTKKGFSETREDDILRIRYSSPSNISGAKRYEISKHEEKTYSIYANPYKVFRSKMITENFEVTITYPENLKVDFLEVGTAIFKDVPCNQRQGMKIIRKKSPEILLSRQGFCLVFRRV